MRSQRPTSPARLSTSRRYNFTPENPGRYQVYLALGSNLGNRARFLARAQRLLQAGGIGIVEKSSIYLTDPEGFRFQPSFLNQVVKARTRLSIYQVLGIIQKVEQKLCRFRILPKGPRTIDIDLLFYHNLVMDTPSLIVPHPGIHRRGFVLLPLYEIAPGLRHPLLGKTVTQMLAQADTSGVHPW